MQFFSKLSQKQILTIFTCLFATFLILVFLVFQLINSQKSGLSADSKQNNSNSSILDSSSISANSNNFSNSVFSSNSSLTSNSSDNSSLPNSQTNSNSNSNPNFSNSESKNLILNSSNFTNSQNDSEKITKFGSNFLGKIGNSSIKMTIDKIEQRHVSGQTYFETLIFGSYSYNSQNKPIELRGKYDHGNQLGSIILEEFVDNIKTGEFSTAGNPNSTFLNTDFYENKFSKIEGTWTNAKSGEKLDFYVVRDSSDTKVEWYYDKQPILLSKTCQESWKNFGNETKNQNVVVNFGNGEKIVSKSCGGMGAYQGTYNYNFISSNGERKLLNFPYFDKVSKTIKKDQTDKCMRSFEWVDKKLTIYCAGRGLNDCGSEDIYKWDSAQKEFELITAKYQEECILNKPENQNKTEKEQQEILKNLKFPVVYQK